jgi:hypothetical protein
MKIYCFIKRRLALCLFVCVCLFVFIDHETLTFMRARASVFIMSRVMDRSLNPLQISIKQPHTGHHFIWSSIFVCVCVCCVGFGFFFSLTGRLIFTADVVNYRPKSYRPHYDIENIDVYLLMKGPKMQIKRTSLFPLSICFPSPAHSAGLAFPTPHFHPLSLSDR